MRNEVFSDLCRATELCSNALASKGLRPIARVIASERAVDLAVFGADKGDLIVRCVPSPSPDDYRALEAMVAESDFDRAAILYTTYTVALFPPSMGRFGGA